MTKVADACPPAVRPRRVVLVVPSLRMGGAERVAASMSAYWVGRGHQVSIVTWVAASDFFRLDPRVRRIRLADAGRMPRHPGRALRRWWRGRADDAGSGRAPGTAPHDLRPPAARRRIGRAAAIEVIARYRLLGSSGAVYSRVLRAVFGVVRSLRRVLNTFQPDVVVSLSTYGNLVTVAASAGLPHRVVVSERNDPSKKPEDGSVAALRAILYPTANAVTANSHGALASMRAFCSEEQLRFVPNPLVLPRVPVDGDLPVAAGQAAGIARQDAVLFLARLEPQKAPDVLLQAFARFVRATPGWRLEMAGDGALGAILRQRVAARGLSDVVRFHGSVANPEPLLAACRVFALPSRYEGTPNALLEAMAHRMACVVSDASPGPLRLIEHEVTGLVVETGSVSGLAEALTTLARDAALRARLGAAARDRVQEFTIDRVGPVWDRIVFPDRRYRP